MVFVDIRIGGCRLNFMIEAMQQQEKSIHD